MADLREELRTLFLFEGMPDAQVDFLVEHGEVVTLDGDATVYEEDEPAAWFYVLLEGGVQMRRRVAGEQVVMPATTSRGVYGGAVRAYLPSGTEVNYGNSLLTTQPSRLYRLRASDLSAFMRRHMPMRHKLAFLASEQIEPARLVALVRIQEDAVERAAKAVRRTATEESALEDALSDWLEARDVGRAWDLAAVFAAAGLDAAWLDEVATAAEGEELEGALHWLAGSLETEALMDELEEATGRIATIVGAVKQRTQMDRAPDAELDLHRDLDATLVLLGSGLSGVTVEREYAEDITCIPAQGGELSQVWTNLLDNAAHALAGRGRLLVRTFREGDRVVIDVVDDGPGIPADVAAQLFEPFFTTKPPGEGTGVGLEIAKEIVERHGGTITVTSRPGETSFRVSLPLLAPPPSP